MDSTRRDSDVSEPDCAFTFWKLVLWREISQAAKAKNAFHQDDYDEYGNIDIHLDKFKELSTWIVCISMAVVTF
jgi:hypothetical protein